MPFHIHPTSAALLITLTTISCSISPRRAPLDSAEWRVEATQGSSWSRSADRLPDHVRTAADLVRCCIHSWHLRTAPGPRGEVMGMPVSSPLLVLDGKPVQDLGWLQAVSARDVERLRVLSPVVAVTYFGHRAGRGAILVQTRRGRPSGR